MKKFRKWLKYYLLNKAYKELKRLERRVKKLEQEYNALQ